MKRKYWWWIFTSLLLILWLYRYLMLNWQYPNPEMHIAKEGEEIEVGGYSFRLKSLEWHDGSIIDQIKPGYVPMYLDAENQIPYPTEKERVVLATVEIRKNEENEEYIDLTNIAFEMGAWGNQWEYRLFTELNGCSYIMLQLNKDEVAEVVFPVMMYDFQFHLRDWKRIENNEFDIILNYYPEKYILRGNY